MARQLSIKNIKTELNKRIDSSLKLYESVLHFIKSDTWEAINGYEALHPGQAKKVIALAFLDVISQWEIFIENCFIRFLAGASYLNGRKPRLRITGCQSIEHSYQLLTLKYKYNPTMSFLSFNSWNDVEARAKIFFVNGEPFSTLNSLEKDRLRDAVIIRNRVAHYSPKCRSDFVKLAKRILNKSKLCGGFSVGEFLITEIDKHFIYNKKQSIFLHYMDLFRGISEKIVKG